MNKYIDEILQQVITYHDKPMYSLQVNKNGCRMLVETNDMPPGTTDVFFGKGESMMISLNGNILKSGRQNIKLKIFPRYGEEVISGYAHIEVKLYYNSNKDSSFNNYECLAKVTLPADIVEMKLPYLELNIPFEAKVPYDFSSRLDNAVDLKNIPGIETMLLRKYEDKKSLIIEGKMKDYMQDEKEGYIMLGNMFYSTHAELLDDLSVGNERFDLGLTDRYIVPFTDYEIVYYNKNKFAIIRNKVDKESILKMSFTYNKKPAFTYSFFILYMPKGSSELKVW